MGNPAIISNELYPEAEILMKHRDVIVDELRSVLHQKWSIWGDYTNSKTSTFTRISKNDIKEQLKNTGLIGSIDPSWRLFGLILYKEILEGAKDCPKTLELLSHLPVLNAGFSCLEAGYSTDRHCDFDKRFYRIHIPLIIPSGDCALDINGTVLKWDPSTFFIIDDTYMHQAWNKTKEHRFVLLVDVERRNQSMIRLTSMLSMPVTQSVIFVVLALVAIFTVRLIVRRK